MQHIIGAPKMLALPFSKCATKDSQFTSQDLFFHMKDGANNIS